MEKVDVPGKKQFLRPRCKIAVKKSLTPSFQPPTSNYVIYGWPLCTHCTLRVRVSLALTFPD